MTKEEKDLLVKDLCARLPYGVKLKNTMKTVPDVDSTVRLYSIDLDECFCKIMFYTYEGKDVCVSDEGLLMPGNFLRYKPYLFPMSSMTEKQKEELNAKTIENMFGEFVCKKNDEMGYGKLMEFDLDFYNKHHLDWRGLIPKGLAIDATGLNIY